MNNGEILEFIDVGKWSSFKVAFDELRAKAEKSEFWLMNTEVPLDEDTTCLTVENPDGCWNFNKDHNSPSAQVWFGFQHCTSSGRVILDFAVSGVLYRSALHDRLYFSPESVVTGCYKVTKGQRRFYFDACRALNQLLESLDE